MAEWAVEQNWTNDYGAEELKSERRSSGFKATIGKYLPVMVDLYAGEAVEQAEGVSFEDTRRRISFQLIGQIMLRALVIDDHGKVVFEQDSRKYA